MVLTLSHWILVALRDYMNRTKAEGITLKLRKICGGGNPAWVMALFKYTLHYTEQLGFIIIHFRIEFCERFLMVSGCWFEDGERESRTGQFSKTGLEPPLGWTTYVLIYCHGVQLFYIIVINYKKHRLVRAFISLFGLSGGSVFSCSCWDCNCLNRYIAKLKDRVETVKQRKSLSKEFNFRLLHFGGRSHAIKTVSYFI